VNILIIGGLLGLAVLALLGAVLLGLGEDRAEKARREAQAQASEAPVLLPQQAQSRPAVSQGPGYQAAPAYQSVPATPILSRSTITLPASSTGEATTKTLNLVELNGQVREITSELRTLAQRASELQQRLASLTESLESQDVPHVEPLHASPPDLFSADTETQVL
jgi:hypothetical protein